LFKVKYYIKPNSRVFVLTNFGRRTDGREDLQTSCQFAAFGHERQLKLLLLQCREIGVNKIVLMFSPCITQIASV